MKNRPGSQVKLLWKETSSRSLSLSFCRPSYLQAPKNIVGKILVTQAHGKLNQKIFKTPFIFKIWWIGNKVAGSWVGGGGISPQWPQKTRATMCLSVTVMTSNEQAGRGTSTLVVTLAFPLSFCAKKDWRLTEKHFGAFMDLFFSLWPELEPC